VCPLLHLLQKHGVWLLRQSELRFADARVEGSNQDLLALPLLLAVQDTFGIPCPCSVVHPTWFAGDSHVLNHRESFFV
jgi:hypothetical protein